MLWIVLGIGAVLLTLWVFQPGPLAKRMPGPLRILVGLPLLPFAWVQAWIYSLAGRPYEPVVYKDRGPKSQQLLPEEEQASEEDRERYIRRGRAA